MSDRNTPEAEAQKTPTQIIRRPIVFQRAVIGIADCAGRLGCGDKTAATLAAYDQYYLYQLIRIRDFNEEAIKSLGIVPKETSAISQEDRAWCSVCEKYLTIDDEITGHCLICFEKKER